MRTIEGRVCKAWGGLEGHHVCDQVGRGERGLAPGCYLELTSDVDMEKQNQQ